MRKRGQDESVFVVDIEGGASEAEYLEATKLDDYTGFATPAQATIHSAITGLYEIGLVDQKTMRKFDQLRLTEVRPMGAAEIQDLRKKVGVSQAVLARTLNVSTNTVGQWERGEKRPTGSALKLLALARKKGLKAIY